MEKAKTDPRSGEAAIIEAVVIFPLVFLVISSLILMGLWFADRSILRERCETFALYASSEYLNPGSYFVLKSENDKDGIDINAVSFLELQRSQAGKIKENDPVWSQIGEELRQSVLNSSLLSEMSVDTSIEVESDIFGTEITVSASKRFKNSDWFVLGLLPEIKTTTKRKVFDFDQALTNGELMKDLTREIVERSDNSKSSGSGLFSRYFGK